MKNKSENFLKVNMWITKYLLFALPFIIAVVVWSLSVKFGGSEFHGLKSFLWESLSWNFMVWFVLLVYFVLLLSFSREFREKILTSITFSSERDERESYLSGRASRATFYSTLSVLILLFFLSGLHLHIYKRPKEEAIDGKRGMLTVGYYFDFVNSAKKIDIENDQKKNAKNEEILVFNGIPFTQESILLFLILYHVSSYHIFSRKRIVE